MSSYSGRHAELYDIMYADKPYAQEAQFVHECLRQFQAPPPERLLELACGTGSHAVRLAQLGYNLVAVDYSADMLACARRKGSGLAVDFRLGNMLDFDFADRPFDATICLFDSIGYVGSNTALSQVFANVHRHLKPGGLFIFEFWHAGAMLRAFDPLRMRRWPLPEGELLRISEVELQVAQQTASVHFTLYELRHDGTYSRLQETQTNRYFLVQEMQRWLTTCGFEALKWFAGYAFDEQITTDTWHVLAVARRQ